jgi:hypothetical protein
MSQQVGGDGIMVETEGNQQLHAEESDRGELKGEEEKQCVTLTTPNAPFAPQGFDHHDEQRRHHVFPSPALCNVHQLAAKTLKVYGVLAQERGVVQMESLLSKPPLCDIKRLQRARNARAAQAKFTKDIVKLPHLQIIEANKHSVRGHSRGVQVNER